MRTCYDWVRGKDEIVKPGYASLHFQTDAKQKTCVGGLVSLGVTLYVFYMALTKGKQMLGLQDPYITSLVEMMDYSEVGKEPFSKMTKPLFEVVEYGGHQTIDLEAENYRQYVHIRARNIIKTYPNGLLLEEEIVYNLRPCRAEDFERNAYEKNYFEAVSSFRHLYCIDVPEGMPEPYMQGTRDSAYEKQEHAYIIYEIRRCTDASRAEDDPECASAYQIDEWLSTKQATFKILNSKIDFSSFDPVALRQNEVYIPNVPLATGTFCDTGYRFRRNTFHRTDHWLSSETLVNPFYDYVFYNSDCYATQKGNELIAELFFRLDIDQITHTRIVLSFMDFIGSLGGVSDILLEILRWVLGGYVFFHSSFISVSALYRIRNKSKSKIFLPSKKNNPSKPQLERIKLSFWTRMKVYLTSLSLLAPLLRRWRTVRMEAYSDLLDEGRMRMRKETDIFYLLKTQRFILRELKALKNEIRSPASDDSQSIIDYTERVREKNSDFVQLWKGTEGEEVPTESRELVRPRTSSKPIHPSIFYDSENALEARKFATISSPPGAQPKTEQGSRDLTKSSIEIELGSQEGDNKSRPRITKASPKRRPKLKAMKSIVDQTLSLKVESPVRKKVQRRSTVGEEQMRQWNFSTKLQPTSEKDEHPSPERPPKFL